MCILQSVGTYSPIGFNKLRIGLGSSEYYMLTMEISIRHYWNTNAKLEKVLLHLRANASSKTIQEPHICIVNSISGYDYEGNYRCEIVDADPDDILYRHYLNLYFGSYSYGFISVDKIYGTDSAVGINLKNIQTLVVNEIPETAIRFANIYRVLDTNNFDYGALGCRWIDHSRLNNDLNNLPAGYRTNGDYASFANFSNLPGSAFAGGVFCMKSYHNWQLAIKYDFSNIYVRGQQSASSTSWSPWSAISLTSI